MSDRKETDFKRSALIKPIRVVVRALSRVLWRIEFRSVENIPGEDGEGLIIASNHQTYIDPFWISVPVVRDIRYLAWDKALEWPILGSQLKGLGAVPVSLSGKSALSTLRSTIRLLKDGYAVMIFPEGSREFEDGEMLPFKTGAAHLAQISRVKILPVKIEGANRVWPQGWILPRFRKVSISFGKVIKPEEIKSAYKETGSLEGINELIRERIEGCS